MVRDKWYHYLIGGVLTVLLYILLGSVLSPVIQRIGSSNRHLNFLNIHLFFAILLTINLLITYYYNKIKPVLLINWNGKINYKSILWGFLIWFSLLIISLIIEVIEGESNLIKTTDISMTLLFLITSILLTPIQILAEEILFRGYLIRFLKKIKNNSLFIILISSVIFASLHMLNPEVEDEKKFLFLVVYLIMSLYLTVLTVTFKGLEYSIGIHMANNFFTINFLNYPNSPLPSMPLYLSEDKIEPGETIINLIVLICITTAIILIRERYVKKRNI